MGKIPFVGGGFDTINLLSMNINNLIAIRLINKGVNEGWSIKKFAEEAIKKSKTARNVGITTMTLSSAFNSLLAAGAGTLGGVQLLPLLIIFIICMTLGLTIGKLLTKRGFIKMVSSYLDDKFITEVDKQLKK